ncbi:MAG: dihydroneopterin aldolase [Burkholderiaceae bacterium]|nr:dihydroneopterin aldolase [Burkholderiaceae bacterium]
MTWYLDQKLKHCRRIMLRDIERQVRIGAYDHERLAPQTVVFNIEVFVNTSNENDDIANAYNYDLVVDAVDRVIGSGHIDLQETVIERIANDLLTHQAVQAVLVRSEKTQAYPSIRSAGIEIFREK